MKVLIAVNKKGIIGNGYSLPWRCSADLKHFKELTMGKTCLVGRKTWEAMPPLEGRNLIVVGSKQQSLDVALLLDIDWVIGGKSIYEQTLHLCDELHISVINDYSDGNVKCPDLSTFEGEIFIYNFEP
ncbi:MAG: dihydrofolate reductase, partial [Bacteroidia bacterium]